VLLIRTSLPKPKWNLIDCRLGSATNTVIPANAGIQGAVQNVLSWTPADAGVTKNFAPSGHAN